jgi:hypothetical protein
MSIHRFRLMAALAALLLALQTVLAACNMPAANQTPTTDPNAIRTSAAQTIQAGGAQQTAAAQSTQTQAAQLTAQASQTQPPLVATTPPSSPPPGPTSPIVTSPSVPPGSGPTISVSLDTNCRLGPSTDYDVISRLAVGQYTTIHGRLADNSWWYVADPRRAGQYCWLWGQYATVQGDIASIPLVAPPPTPTYVATGVEFLAAFSNVHGCGSVDVAVIQINNTSAAIFRSMHIVVKDPITGSVVGEDETNAPFMSSGADCPPGLNHLDPGRTAFVASPLDDLLPSGAEVRAIITLCTDQNLGGDCAESRVVFEIP